jgi:electron transfer flavoprotein beta subunit
VNDRRAAASDTLATSYILSQAVRKIGRCDLILCGRQAIDGDTAQVGPQLAEKLGLAQVTYFEKLVDLRGQTVLVRRNVGNGWEIVEGRLPMLLTVLDTANEPRPAAAKRVMRFKRSRSWGEIAGELGKNMADATPQEREAEQGRRLELLKVNGLVIEQWDLDEIKADLRWCGMSGSPTKVHRVQAIVLSKEGYTEVPNTEEGVRRMIRELIIDHTLG